MSFALWARANACAVYFDMGSVDELVSDFDHNEIALLETIADISPSPEWQCIERSDTTRLQDFLQSLPPRLAFIAHRHYWLDQSQTQIATDLGVTRSAVCHALARICRLGRAFFKITEH